MESPLIIVLAGPNGAGKSTFHDEFLSELGLPFINADLIAKSVFGGEGSANAYAAAELAEQARQQLVSVERSFIMETVLSDPEGEKVAFLAAAQAKGYTILANFIGLDSPDLSAARVQTRIEAGGHSVPPLKLFQRYPRTLDNLAKLLPVADQLWIYDNSSTTSPFRLVAHFSNGVALTLASPMPAWTEPLHLATFVSPQTTYCSF
jgi:predicted ABC-type ATPase